MRVSVPMAEEVLGARVPPTLTVTAPLMMPVPARVAFEHTVTALAALSWPLTWTVQLVMVVGPV